MKPNERVANAKNPNQSELARQETKRGQTPNPDKIGQAGNSKINTTHPGVRGDR